MELINRNWSREYIDDGKFKQQQEFQDYESIIELLTGMLQKDPQKRWDFKQIRTFYEEKENDPKFRSQIPNDEVEKAEKYLVHIKDGKNENLEKLLDREETMYLSYQEKLTRTKEANIFFIRALNVLEKINQKIQILGEKKLIELMLKSTRIFLNYEKWWEKNGNLWFMKELLNNDKKIIDEFRGIIPYNKIAQLEAEMYLFYGSLYQNKGKNEKA